MFVFQFPFPFAQLIGCLTRSVRFDLQRLRYTPLPISLLFVHYAIGELIKSLANWKNCQLRFLFLYHRILLLLYGLHTHSKLLCKCSVSVVFFIRFLKRVWPHEQRLYWSLDWYMAYARHRRNVFSSWSVNQLTSCAGSAVPRRWLSQN